MSTITHAHSSNKIPSYGLKFVFYANFIRLKLLSHIYAFYPNQILLPHPMVNHILFYKCCSSPAHTQIPYIPIFL